MRSKHESFEYKGRVYKITPDFRNVLAMWDAFKVCFPWEREKIILHFLTKGKTPKDPGFLHALIDKFFPKADGDGERVIDIQEDMPYIYAAFLQAYGIDLDKGLSWFRFIDLLNALPDSTTYSHIVQIRARKIPPLTKTNAEERATLMRLKAKYKIHKSDEEKDADLQRSLSSLVQSLGVLKNG